MYHKKKDYKTIKHKVKSYRDDNCDDCNNKNDQCHDDDCDPQEEKGHYGKKKGPRGHRDKKGPRGHHRHCCKTDPTDPPDPPDPPGPTGASSSNITSASSGNKMELTFPGFTARNEGFVGVIGFGNFATIVVHIDPFHPVTPIIDIPFSGIVEFSFSMPRTGILDSISGLFIVTAARSTNPVFHDTPVPPILVNVQCSVYTSSGGITGPTLNQFTPLYQLTLNPAISSTSALPAPVFGNISGLNLTLPVQTRVLIVFQLITGIPGVSVTGYAEAGLGII